MRQLVVLLLTSGLLLLQASLCGPLPGSLPPALSAQQATPGPFDEQSPLEPPTLAVEPTPTVEPTASPSPTPTPEPTATATIAPYQVSPLVAQETGGLPDDGSTLWVGAAALLVLGGSAVLAGAEKRRR